MTQEDTWLTFLQWELSVAENEISEDERFAKELEPYIADGTISEEGLKQYLHTMEMLKWAKSRRDQLAQTIETQSQKAEE